MTLYFNRTLKKIFEDEEAKAYFYNSFFEQYDLNLSKCQYIYLHDETIREGYQSTTIFFKENQRLIKLCCTKDSIILDSFAGSGTTAQAVLNLNNNDSGKRKFILVEMLDYAEETTAERLRNVILGYVWCRKK